MRPAATIIWRVVPDEHVRAVRALQSYHSRLESRLTRELRLAGLAALALAGAGVIAWQWRETHTAPLALFVLIGFPAVCAGLFYGLRPVAVKHSARRQLLDNPLTLQQRRYTLEAGGIEIAGETFVDNFAWSEITRVSETGEFFLIFTQRSAYYLPKRAIAWPETLENLRAVFTDSIGDRATVR